MKKIIASSKAPAAIGPYSQAVQIDGILFVSGQLPVNAETGEMADDIATQTRQSLDNIGHIVSAAGFSFSDIAKTTVLLSDINDFAVMNAVYSEYFPEDKPARVCYQVTSLPKGAKVEIDAVAGK